MLRGQRRFSKSGGKPVTEAAVKKYRIHVTHGLESINAPTPQSPPPYSDTPCNAWGLSAHLGASPGVRWRPGLAAYTDTLRYLYTVSPQPQFYSECLNCASGGTSSPR